MRLKRERLKARLTQMELARFSGVTQPTISKLENGVLLDPGFDTLANLAWALKKCGRKVDAADLQPKKQLQLVRGFRAARQSGHRKKSA